MNIYFLCQTPLKFLNGLKVPPSNGDVVCYIRPAQDVEGHVAEDLKKNGVTVIYSETLLTNETSEKADIDILSPYALTKWLGEQLVLHWVKRYNLSAISLRFFNVYGPRSNNSGSYSAVINIFIKQKLSKKPFTIVGDGSQTRSFVYISDVVKAMIKAAKSKISGEIFNVGGKKSVQINKIAELLGGKKIYIPKRKGELKKSSANIIKIKKKLFWKPEVNINAGLSRLLKEF